MFKNTTPEYESSEGDHLFRAVITMENGQRLSLVGRSLGGATLKSSDGSTTVMSDAIEVPDPGDTEGGLIISLAGDVYDYTISGVPNALGLVPIRKTPRPGIIVNSFERIW